MSLINLLASRRKSVRKYNDNPIEPSALTDVLESALKAPTSKNTRGVRFVVVEDRDTLLQLSLGRKHGSKFVATAPIAVVVCVDTHVSARPMIDAAIAATYLQLAVTDNDLGSCWAHVADTPADGGGSVEEYVRRILCLPDHYAVLCMIAIGDPANFADLEPQEKELPWEHVFIGRYEERQSMPQERNE